MTPETLVQFLHCSGHMTRQQAEETAGHFRPKRLPKHAFLLRAGHVSDEYLFLEQGLLRAFVYDPQGQEVTTSFYSRGQVALEVVSFFNRTPAQEQLQAVTPCSGWVISYEPLNALFHGRPEFREFGRFLLVRALATLQQRLLDQIQETASTRYAKLLHASPDILLHAPLKQVASYLGITDSSLSRIRAEASR